MEPRIEVVDYDPSWPLAFAEIERVVAAALGELALRIEHVGSTAVPGLAAKPIIDMDAVIADLSLLPQAISALHELGYEYQGDLGVAGRYAFKWTAGDVPRDGSGRQWQNHHLYVCPQDSPELARHTAFRDYLRGHLVRAEAYAALKRSLAERFPYDIDAYIEGKSAFIEAALREAAL
jgi:GrpB-like predicted nucleotidyltransferase (UPF0157 family)